jgi:iron complex outermembrane recepter protein
MAVKVVLALCAAMVAVGGAAADTPAMTFREAVEAVGAVAPIEAIRATEVKGGVEPLRAESVPLESTPPVEGVVRGEDGGAVPHAGVTVVASGRSTLTDAAGRFRLTGLAAGRHRLEVSMLGYRPVQVEVEIPAAVEAAAGGTAAGGTAAGETARVEVVRVEVVLVRTPLSLPGVQVTATPMGRDALQVAQATAQLSGRALERALGPTLAQTLGGQPGMAVRYNGPAASAPVLRGLTGDRILILQDGQRVGDLSGTADDHSVTVDPLSAQRIEVVRGPASLLYGTNALGGVVNVISGDGTGQVPLRPQWSASLQAESAFPGGSATVRTVLPLADRWALTLRAGGRSTGDVRIAADPELGRWLANTSHRNASGAVGVAYAGGALTAGATLQAYAMAHGVPLPPEADEEIELRGRRVGASGHAEWQLGSARFPSLRLQAGAVDYAHDELADGAAEMAFGLRTQTADATLRQGRLGPFRDGAWGVSGLARQYVATGEEQLTAPANARSLGVYTFQEAGLPGGAALQAGARLDRYAIASLDDPLFGPGVDRSFTTVSGSVGATVPLAAGVSGAVSAARSFRAPTVEEMFSSALHIGTASFEVGDPDLRPESAAGLDALVRVARGRVSAELATYASTIDGFIHMHARGDTVLDGVRWPVLAYVQERARFTGVEGHIEWEAARGWVLGAQGDVVRGELRDGTRVPFLPAARAGASVRRDDGVTSLGAGVRYAFAQGGASAAGETPVHAYTLVDAHAGYRITRGGRMHSFSLRADNVLDVLYRDAASRVRDFAPNPGRNISLLYRVYF